MAKKQCRFHSSWSELPESFDWRDYSGVLSRTRDQGRCASCWAFSVTHAIQSALKLNRGVSVLLSKQELLDCVYHEKDEGGWLDLSYAYIYRYGSALEKYYRYDDAYDLPCETVSRRVYIDGFARCDSSEESLMKAVLNQPISVSLCAGIELLDGYQKGDIFDAPRCHIFDEEGKLKAIDNDDINHFALLVGYGSNDGNDYWILQNSWGKAWGDKGFFF
ncbi:hypothetical protein P8452_46243 [Trifolium repens]|nr:senescence-specific cysteine protease SAG39 [Trifolium repens]WJX61115.1 hypothetical protein P8452_46243 [Trifolium repens]